MLTPYYARLMSAQADGAAVTAAAATSMLPTAAKYTFPASFFQFIGQEIHIRAAGRFSTTTGTNTIIFNVMFGSIAVFSPAAVTLIASQTNMSWIYDATLTLRAVGSGTSANFMGTGSLQANAAILANGNVVMPATAPVVGNGFDSTSSQAVDFQCTWSATGNSAQLHQFSLDAAL